MSTKFRIHKTGDPVLPWAMDYPEPRPDGRIGIACSTLAFAIAEFIDETERQGQR